MGLLLAISVAFGATFGPALFGARVGLTITVGQSMEPALHSGDLVITRTDATYEIGDVIVYTIPDGEPGEGRKVIHRITGGDATAGFVTTGDNRHHPDRWHPRPSDIVGRQWFTVPFAGTVLIWLRSPLLIGVAVCLMVYSRALTVLSAGSAPVEQTAPEKGARRRPAARLAIPRPPMGAASAWVAANCRPKERRHRRRWRPAHRGAHFCPRSPRPVRWAGGVGARRFAELVEGLVGRFQPVPDPPRDTGRAVVRG
ncbi:MAG: signal peptidase I [Actinomycetia bacterium]|nr:signal peptidase I [Actinomycetes bacterium]